MKQKNLSYKMKLVVFILFALVELIISKENNFENDNLYPKLDRILPLCRTCGEYCFMHVDRITFAEYRK